MSAWPMCTALLLSALAAPAAPESGWYRGLIGRTATALDTPERYEQNKEVEMELRVDGSAVSGAYFYFDAGKGERGADIALQGRVTGRTLQLEEKGDAARVTGKWQGTISGPDFAGTWTDPAGKRRLLFFLSKLPDEPSEQKPIAPGIAYRGRRVVGTNLVLPFLTQHPSAAVMKRVNDEIAADFSDHRCSPGVAFSTWPDDFSVDWKVSHASAELLSVAVSESWFCGAAYPSGEDRSFTFDLKTGKRVAFEDLFRDYEKNKDAILQVLFADVQKQASPECKEEVAPDAAGEAGSGPRFVSGSFAFSLSATTLRVQEIDVPHAVVACGVRAEVPYGRVLRFVAPGGAIARLLESKPGRR